MTDIDEQAKLVRATAEMLLEARDRDPDGARRHADLGVLLAHRALALVERLSQPVGRVDYGMERGERHARGSRQARIEELLVGMTHDELQGVELAVRNAGYRIQVPS